MIYPWYEEENWLQSRFTGDEGEAKKKLREFSPSPAVVYFRHSYASFRVNGFEYACLPAQGRLRYGIKHALLESKIVPPGKLVEAICGMYELLADGRRADEISHWANANYEAALSRFISHAARHQQDEHWLESMILKSPSVIAPSIDQLRSQVVAAGKGEKPEFIDLLGLDRQNKVLWIVEIKAKRVTTKAVDQARRYAEWLCRHMKYILDPAYRYFDKGDDEGTYSIGVCLAGPGFSSNVSAYAKEKLGEFQLRLLEVNSSWRQELRMSVVTEDLCGGEKRRSHGLQEYVG